MMLCSKPLRDGPCQMDSGHRGRCSTVTFFCDGCQKTRRGQPVAHDKDYNGDEVTDFCWFCCNVNQEHPREYAR